MTEEEKRKKEEEEAAAAKAAADAAAKPKSDDDDADYDTWLESLSPKRRKAIKAQATKLSNLEAEAKTAKEEAATLRKAKEDEDTDRKKKNGEWEQVANDRAAELEAAQQRIMRAELRLHAQAEGIYDPSDVNNMDLSSVTYDSKTGEVHGAEKAIKKLKADKPHWFKVEDSGKPADGKPPEPKPANPTKPPAPTPSPSEPKPFDATTIKDKAEYEQVKRDRMAALAGKW